jgi:hypothetical protein
VIYIIGAGRSGTTLLDIVLGNASGVRSCGELVRFPELQGNPHGVEPGTDNHVFWKRVQARLEEKLGGAIDFLQLERLVSRVDYHRAFPATYFNTLKDDTITRYARYAGALYDSVFDEIGDPVIVDSSKYPSRALALYRYLDYDIRYVYLARHPAMVVKSFARRGLEQSYKNLLAANQYYFLVNMACNLALGRMHDVRVARVTYEQLTSDPVSVLQGIQQDIDIDLGAAIDKVSAGRELEVDHLFEGNRIRLQKQLVLRRSSERYTPSTIPERFTGLLNAHWWRKNQRAI